MTDSGTLPSPETLEPQGLADILAQLALEKRHAEAGPYAARLLQLRPGHRRALRALFRAPQPGVDVLAGWIAVMDSEPADDEAPAKVARLRLAVNDAVGALDAAEAAVARNPANTDGHEIRFRALLQLDRHEAIRVAWLDFHRALPDRAVALARKAVDHASAGRDERAALLGAMASAEVLNEAGREAFEHAQALSLSNAYAAEVDGRLVDAAGCFRQLALLDGTEEEVVGGLARVEQKLRERLLSSRRPTPESAEAARMLARLAPLDLVARRHLIEAATLDGDWSAAAGAWHEFFDTGGDRSADHELALFEAYARGGEVDRAVPLWNALRADASAGLQVRLDRIREILVAHVGASFDKALGAEQWHGAWRALEQALACEMGDAQREAMRHRLRGALANAIKTVPEEEQAKRLDLLRLQHVLDPDHSAIALKLGRALMRNRLFDEARAVWTVLIELTPDAVEPWLQLARSARRTNAPDLAADAARRTLALDPAHAEAAAILAEVAGPDDTE